MADEKLYIAVSNGWVKIGVSADPAGRVSDIQTGNPHPIELEKVVEHEHPRFAEEVLHHYFRGWRGDGGGEWFDLHDRLRERLIGETDRYIDRAWRDYPEWLPARDSSAVDEPGSSSGATRELDGVEDLRL